MVSRPEILNKADYSKALDEMKDPDKKLDFLAWRLYDMQQDIADIKTNCAKSCKDGGSPDKKQAAANVTGIAGFFSALGLFIWELIRMRGGS